ncbi:MAG: glycosyltransferase family 2 protein, partial [Hasllibacter sp.]
MTPILPDLLSDLTASAGRLADFLERTEFPNRRAVEDLRAVSTVADLVELHDRRRHADGLVDLVTETVRAVHTSPAFDAHARSEAVRGSGLGVPRLRTLLPARPDPETWRGTVLDALVRTLAAHPRDRADALRLWLHGGAFAEVTARPGAEAALMGDLMKGSPGLGLAVMEDAEAMAVLAGGADRALMLAGCAYFAANRHFERCHALARALLARLDPDAPEASDAFDHLWYAAFRLGRLEEARAAVDAWVAARPLLKRPLVFGALLASVTDAEAGLAQLEVAGADLGRATVGGNVLYVEGLLRRGRVAQAERALRHAIHEDRPPKGGGPRVDYAIALHNVMLARGLPSQALQPVLAHQDLDLRWRGPLDIDAARDLSEAPEARGHVAVVMTAWQAEAHLERAMRGVLEQSHRDLRLIVMDDCSEDATGAVARRLAEEDARVTLRRTSRNVGTYAAKNEGIRLA